MRKDKAICLECAKKAELEFFLLSPSMPDAKCGICGSKYNLVHYGVLMGLNMDRSKYEK